MDLDLWRFSYAASETEGVLDLPDHDLATIERPWVPVNAPGGKPFASCVPDGKYQLDPWIRGSDGSEVYILSNPELGVYKLEEDMPNGVGRFLILLHIANYVRNVVGCIGPGIARAILRDKKTGTYERAVSSSGEAMRILRRYLGREETHTLTIRPRCGTGGTT
jgi:hypothetical protein